MIEKLTQDERNTVQLWMMGRGPAEEELLRKFIEVQLWDKRRLQLALQAAAAFLADHDFPIKAKEVKKSSASQSVDPRTRKTT